MGRKAAATKRTTTKNSDPTLDYFAMFDARSMLLSNMLTMGWRLAVMVLLPIFLGVQLDKRFDSSPSLTLAAFFIAIFGAGVMIYRAYIEMTAQVAQENAKKAKRKNIKRTKNA
jgi:F0F1-type ATP synthase assembly protein I